MINQQENLAQINVLYLSTNKVYTVFRRTIPSGAQLYAFRVKYHQ